MKTVVIGGGAFGTAMAVLLANCGCQAEILVRDSGQRDEINTRGINRKYLPDLALPSSVRACTNPRHALADADYIFCALPSQSIGPVAGRLLPFMPDAAVVINLAKGLHSEHFTLDAALRVALPGRHIGSAKGPNFARPLLTGAPSGMTLAADDPGRLAALMSALRGSAVQVECWDNVTEVEFISALKNVMAIAMGICDAQDDNPNTRFLVLKRLVAESVELLEALGYSRHVLLTYAGIGDLLMTALNDASRNRTLGLLIGRGFDFVRQGEGPVTEGRKTVCLLVQRLHRIGSAVPPVLSLLHELFERSLRPQDFHRRLTRHHEETGPC